MLIREYRPSVQIFSSEGKLDRHAGLIVIEELQKKPDSVFTIATGASTHNLLLFLVKAYQKKKVSFRRVKFFVLDEYWPVPEERVSTLWRLTTLFFQHIDIPQENIYFPNGRAEDLEREVRRFQGLFKRECPLDLAILGIGPGKTCHLGLNERGSGKDTTIRYVPLDKESQEALKKKLNIADADIPRGGITLGIGDLLEAKKVVVIAKGDKKAWGIKRSLNGPISPDAPASFLRYHPHAFFLLDAKAAGKR